MPDADVLFYPAFFDPDESRSYLKQLTDEIDWKQESATLFGRPVPLPRLTAWYGEEGATYRYSGITVEPLAWTPALLAIKARVEQVCPARFNSVLLNLYRSGRDSVSWHSDDEPSLGRNPVIASVSFGVSRVFQLRHKDTGQKQEVFLSSGSLLLMQGGTQHFWQHQIPKRAGVVGARINLTFRVIVAR
jgi:alkylated DNA repair dioxygenase AlkB